MSIFEHSYLATVPASASLTFQILFPAIFLLHRSSIFDFYFKDLQLVSQYLWDHVWSILVCVLHFWTRPDLVFHRGECECVWYLLFRWISFKLNHNPNLRGLVEQRRCKSHSIYYWLPNNHDDHFGTWRNASEVLCQITSIQFESQHSNEATQLSDCETEIFSFTPGLLLPIFYTK